MEQIACAISERILDDWASLSCSGRSGKGDEMLPPSFDILLAARRSSSDKPVGMDIWDARVAGRTNDRLCAKFSAIANTPRHQLC